MIPPQKAKIVSIETSDTFEFQYNPKEFSLKRNSGISGGKGQGPWGGLTWQCPNPDELSMEFVIDVSEASTTLETLALLLPISSLASMAGMADTSSILKNLGDLYVLSIPHKIEDSASNESYRPPYVAFLWGDFQFFGAIQNIDTKVVLFDFGGIPKRAEVSLTMLGQAMNPPGKSEELAGIYTPPYKWLTLKKSDFDISKAKSTDPRVGGLLGGLIGGGGMSTFKAGK